MIVPDNLLPVVTAPLNFAARVRNNLGLKEHEPLRVSNVPGPGDVAGTYQYLRHAQHDPRVPSVTFSLQFYALLHYLNAECQMLTRSTPQGFVADPRDNIVFEAVTREPATTRFNYIKSNRQYIANVAAKIDAFDPHIVIVGTDFPAAGFKRVSQGRKLILEAHNTYWPMGSSAKTLKATVKKAYLAKQCRAFDAAVYTSHECQRQMSQLTRPNTAGEVHMPQLIEHYPVGQKNQANNLVYLGRIEADKGVFFLLESFLAVHKKHPALTLTIAGSGSAENALTQHLQTLNSPAIRFVGSLNAHEVHAALSKADALICPTMTRFNEGLALVCFEAAAHGVPSIVSSVVPAKELLSESCLVYPADHQEGLTAAITTLVTQHDQYKNLCEKAVLLKEKMYNRELSMGSCMARVMLSL